MLFFQNLFLEPEPVRAELLLLEPERNFFYLEPEPEPKKNTWSRSLGKNGSAPQHRIATR